MIALLFVLAAGAPFDLDASVSRGRTSYARRCLSCHLEQGEGVTGVNPPLAGSDYLLADKLRAVREVLFGLRGPITVNGARYDGEMAGLPLGDREASDVVNYIRNAWGNRGEAVRPEEVGQLRAQRGEKRWRDSLSP